MQKVYLLLRDNKQTGPHSLEELLQLGLKPYDLVWVEGRSCGWSYPSEINALKSYAPAVPEAPALAQSTESMPSTPPTYTTSDLATASSPKTIAPPKNIFVRLPGKERPAAPPVKEAPPASDWDRRVEELRQRAQAYTPAAPVAEEPAELNTNYARSLDEVEEQYTDWMYRQKTKKKPRLSGKQISTLAIGLILVGGGYLAASSLIGGRQKESAPVQRSSKPLTVQQPEEEKTVTPEPETVSGPVVYEDEPSAKEPQRTAPVSHKETKQRSLVLPAKNPVAKSTPLPRPQAESTHKVEHLPPVDNPTVMEEKKQAADEPVAAAPKAKKKSLADKIDGFIEKIASKGLSGREPKEEQPTTQPDPGTGERRSTRRDGEGAPAVDNAELARQVEVVANQTDNWMMGVKDLKLTVRNYSTVPIRSAAIEVSYYSENDNLLEKKTVYASAIPARGRKTIAAPDQRLADHVSFRVVSVSADEEAYARQ